MAKTVVTNEGEPVNVDKLFASLGKGKKADEAAKEKQAAETAVNDAVVAQQTLDRKAKELEEETSQLKGDLAKNPSLVADAGDFSEKQSHDKAQFAEGEKLVSDAVDAADAASDGGSPEERIHAAALSMQVDESTHPTTVSVPAVSDNSPIDDDKYPLIPGTGLRQNVDGYTPPVDMTPAVKTQAAAANIQNAEREANQARNELRDLTVPFEANANDPPIDWKDPTITVALTTDHAIGPNANQPPDMNAEAMPDPAPGEHGYDHNALRHTRAYLDDKDAEANMSEQTRLEISAGKAALKARQKLLAEAEKADEEDAREQLRIKTQTLGRDHLVVSRVPLNKVPMPKAV